MGRARWASLNWPNILEGCVVKLAARIKSEPIGQTRIGLQLIQVRARQTRLARIFFKIFKNDIYIYINDLLRFFSKSYSDHTNEDKD